ncbi:HD domain-containing protein, partial [candidate division WWE3 bacterium]|nr:HD domain-containing protein [candidate division WWE3 bacterium]
PTERLELTGKKIVEQKMLEHLPTERITEEFLKWAYHSTSPAIGLEYLREIGALPFISQSVAKMVDTKQTPEWHPEGSVWIHTLQCVSTAAEVAQREQLAPFEKATLLFGAFCHDLGKTTTTEFQPDRKVFTSYGHHLASEELSRQLLERLNMPKYLRDAVPLLVKHHMQLRTLFVNEREGTDQTKAFQRLQRELHQTNVTAEMLLWLAEADMRARNADGGIFPVSSEQAGEYLQIKQWTEDKLHFLQEHGDTKDEMVSGTMILDVLGKQEGKWVGAIKELLHDFVTDQSVREVFSHPELFTGDNAIQPNIIVWVFTFCDERVTQGKYSWDDISTSSTIRDTIIGGLLKQHDSGIV